MSGVFRDASAAIERAAILERENEELRRDLSELADLREGATELAALRTEVASLRAIARGENEDAYFQRLAEERDDLRREVRRLRSKVEALEQAAAKHRFERKANSSELSELIGSLVEAILKSLRGSANKRL